MGARRQRRRRGVMGGLEGRWGDGDRWLDSSLISLGGLFRMIAERAYSIVLVGDAGVEVSSVGRYWTCGVWWWRNLD